MTPCWSPRSDLNRNHLTPDQGRYQITPQGDDKIGGPDPIRTDVPGISHQCYAYSATDPFIFNLVGRVGFEPTCTMAPGLQPGRGASSPIRPKI